MHLADLGWTPYFESHFEPFRKKGYAAMRIIRQDRDKYTAAGELGEFSCKVSGKYRFQTDSKGKFPAVGDWVVTSTRPNEKKATIHEFLPRNSVFSRKVAGQITDEQVIAANIDILFIVCGLDMNFNVRRIERYLSIAWDSRAEPVVLLNKADLCSDIELLTNEVRAIVSGVDILAISATEKYGIDAVSKYIKKGKTVAFVGSSGVGKSTIINSLLGTERLKVNEVNEYGSRGRHTTTSRELIMLPGGGMVIDTPGMRELQVWGDEEGLKKTFDDIDDLSKNCRFRNCRHENEPGCAVQEAISNDSLDKKRFNSYLKLKREYAYLADRQTMKPDAIEKDRWKAVSKYAKELKKRGKNK